MIQLQSRRTPRMVLALCLAAAAAWMAPAAHATDYCVAPNTSCGGTNVATFQAALDAADNVNDSDRIFLGAATYTAPTSTGFSYNSKLAPLEIVGAGSGQTILTGQIGGSTSVLFLIASPGSSIHDLTLRLPQNVAGGFAGLDTNAAAELIDVVEAPSQANLRTGVRLRGVALERSSVTLGDATNTIGVSFEDGGEALRDATVQARTAVSSSSGGSVQRSALRGGGAGVAAYRGSTTVTDSLILVTEDVSAGIDVVTQVGGSATTVNTDGVTLIGPPSVGALGVFVSNSLENTLTANANIADTVIRGFGRSLRTEGYATGAANISASYSDYDPSGNIDNGPGTITASNVTNVGDARFVDAAGGDYRLRFNSPLVDIGEPGAPSTLTDLAGGARLVDGDAVVGARRDIGAYEYQAQSPVAAISGPATALTGEQVSFSGAGSTDPDPGDTIAAYAWTVDEVAAGNGPTLSTTFQSAGDHVVGLTVTDPIGRQASVTHAVTVSGESVGPQPTPQGDTTAPVISHLLARPARALRGRAISFAFSLDEPATVSVKIQRALPGRREGSACRKPGARNRTARRCTRHVLVSTLNATGTTGANGVRFSAKAHRRPLARGHYRALITATDAAGNRSAVRRVSFTIV